MTDLPRKQTLPSLPNLDRLRKDAKARLADMRKRVPTTQLADAQFVLAREYGFANWTALKEEVERRICGPIGQYARIRRTPMAVARLPPVQEADVDFEAQAGFIRTAAAAHIGIFAVMVGVGIIFLAIQPHSLNQAALQKVVQLFQGPHHQ